jgi:hypothetical protein
MTSADKKLARTVGLISMLLSPACSDEGDRPRRGVPSEHPGVKFESTGPTITADGVKAAIRGHVRAQSEGGVYLVKDALLGKTWRLTLDTVHDPVRTFEDDGRRIYFACAEFRSVGEDDVLDIDIWLFAGWDELEVTETKIHKVNGEARFGYDGLRTVEIE